MTPSGRDLWLLAALVLGAVLVCLLALYGALCLFVVLVGL